MCQDETLRILPIRCGRLVSLLQNVQDGIANCGRSMSPGVEHPHPKKGLMQVNPLSYL